jgi:hypothetical protein
MLTVSEFADGRDSEVGKVGGLVPGARLAFVNGT